LNALFGTEVLANEDWLKLIGRLAVDLFFATLVIRAVYYRVHRNREYVFTYYLFNVITFSMCILLRKVPMELGFALGLFAVFGILRYRTEAIRIIDLTYLFIVIGLGILNSAASKTISVAEVLTVNTVIVLLIAGLEFTTTRTERSTPLLYDKLDLLRPGSELELLSDLSDRTGLRVVRVQVQRIDMIRDAAEITIFYTPPRG
jgi:hypothetical protein